MRFKTAISKWLLVGAVRAESGHSYDLPLMPHMLLKFLAPSAFSLYVFYPKGTFFFFSFVFTFDIFILFLLIFLFISPAVASHLGPWRGVFQLSR